MKYIFLLLVAVKLCTPLHSQQFVSGTVRSETSKLPLESASIRLITSGRATTTDNQGNFEIMVSNDSTWLVVSYVGYHTDTIKIKMPLVNPLTINLRPAKEHIREVLISTGYQHMPKETSTGSFSYIDNNTFNQQVSTDVLSRLEAIAGGYMVDRRSGLPSRSIIRGLGTLNGPTDPLVILDNFPYDGNLDNINPNEVEDITILKDASSASIWGARAANGVIVIRTKQGHFNRSLRIDVQASATIGNKPNLDYVRQMSSSDFIDVEQMLYGHGYYTARINQNTKPPLSPVVELMIKRETAEPDELPIIENQINAYRSLDLRDDLKKYVYRPSIKHQYALGIYGGAQTSAWVASVGYDQNLTNLDAKYRRVNLRFQNRFKPLSWLETALGVRYTLSGSEKGRDGFGDISVANGNIYPYAQLADAIGNPLPLTKQYRQTFIDEANADGILLNWSYIPLEDYAHVDNTSKLDDIVATASVNVIPAQRLKMGLEYQFERQGRTDWVSNGINSYYTRNLLNYYSEVGDMGTLVRRIPIGDILDFTKSDVNSHQARGKLNFNHDWRRHHIAAIAGIEMRHLGDASNSYRTYGYDNSNLTFGTVDFLNAYPNYINGARSFIPRQDNFQKFTTRFISMFMNGAYIHDKRFTISISGRRDASNLFGLDVNDQWNLFWSIGGAWNISKEHFFISRWMPDLRLRMTYGKSGNIDPSMVAATTMAYTGVDQTTMTPAARFNNYYNPDLKWETTTMTNIAVDFGVLNGRINGVIDYYHKKGTDLFGMALIDYTGGVGINIRKNASSMRGNGFDFEFNSINIDTDFKWQSNIRLSHYKDKVIKNTRASTTTTAIVSSVGGTTGLLAVEGKPVNAVYSFTWAGLHPETGDPMGYVDGEASRDYNVLLGSRLDLDDLVYHGSAVPTWFGSFGNTFSYERLSINLGLVYRFGYFFRRPSIRYSSLFSNWQNAHSDFSMRWQRPGDEHITNVPSIAYPISSLRDTFHGGAEILVERGDHIRLQYLQVSYRVPVKTKTSLNDLQLYLNVNDVGVVWSANKMNLDPDFVGIRALKNPTSYSMGIRFSVN